MGQLPPPPPGANVTYLGQSTEQSWAGWVYFLGVLVFSLSAFAFVMEIIDPSESIWPLVISGTLSGLTFGLVMFYTIWAIMGYNDD